MKQIYKNKKNTLIKETTNKFIITQITQFIIADKEIVARPISKTGLAVLDRKYGNVSSQVTRINSCYDFNTLTDKAIQH